MSDGNLQHARGGYGVTGGARKAEDAMKLTLGPTRCLNDGEAAGRTKGRSKREQRLRRAKRTRAHLALASSCPLQGANDATTDSISRSGQDPRRRTRGERKMNTESKIKIVRGYTRAYGNTCGKRASKQDRRRRINLLGV